MSQKINYSPWVGLAKNDSSIVQPYASRKHKDLQPLFDMAQTQELTERYGPDWKQAADLLHKDMGLEPAKIRFNAEADLDPGTMGGYGNRNLYVSSRLRGADKLPTISHELGHAADDLHEGYQTEAPARGPRSQSDEATMHHKHFVNFDMEFPLVLSAQRNIEQGDPINPELYQRFPYLRKVVPQSSNRLANPWNLKDSQLNLIPAEPTNAEKMAESLKKLGLNPRIQEGE